MPALVEVEWHTVVPAPEQVQCYVQAAPPELAVTAGSGLSVRRSAQDCLLAAELEQLLAEPGDCSLDCSRQLDRLPAWQHSEVEHYVLVVLEPEPPAAPGKHEEIHKLSAGLMRISVSLRCNSNSLKIMSCNILVKHVPQLRVAASQTLSGHAQLNGMQAAVGGLQT